MSRTLAILLLSAASLARAQLANLPPLSVEISPNPAPLGATITFSISDPFGLVRFPRTEYAIDAIRRGPPPYAAIVGQPLAIGTPPLIPASGQGSIDVTWNQIDLHGFQLPPGRYWAHVQSTPIPYSWVYRTHAFPFTITDQPMPVVQGESTAHQPGTPYVLTLDAGADHAGRAYVAALSATTDDGFRLGGFLIPLDEDWLFWASFPSPLPGLFANLQGSLDVNGRATLILAPPPSTPPGTWICAHVQAIVEETPTLGTLTNVEHILFEF